MKKIIEMSDSQKEKLARWVPSIVSILIAAGSFVFNYGYASAKLEAQDKRVTALETKQQNYEVLVEKIKNVEENTKSTSEQLGKLSEEIKDIFKNYKLEHK
jgi:DNA gyrase/topoisomerase IV subunit A